MSSEYGLDQFCVDIKIELQIYLEYIKYPI